MASKTNVPTVLAGSMFSDMMYLRDSKTARASSYDRSGRNRDCCTVPPGETLRLADIPGAGCIRHIYFTIMGAGPGDPRYLRDLVLRMYWDGTSDPSVEVPFGDFFGQGHERIRFFRSLMVTVNEGAELLGGDASTLTVGFNSYFPMPFADGARLTLTNDGDYEVGAVWYHIDYEKMDKLESGVGRFHAQWRRENTTVAVGDNPNNTIHNEPNTDGAENYVILDAEGHGNFVGYFLNVDNLSETWYGEGDDMIFVDGEGWPPSLHGTGTEECFGGGACPNVEYAGPYTGFHLIGNKNFAGKTSMYRFHVADPIRFQKSIRVTIEHGHANNFANDYSSTAFWYQALPHKPFPELPGAADRRPRQGDDPHDRAHLGFSELQQKAGRCGSLASQKEIQMPAELKRQVFEVLAPEIRKAFDEKDYAAAADKCKQANDLLDAFIKEHE